ncbi:MAG: PocR ligand-binding domain-containing protein [Deltaproteobacteria bacterium]|nr:PocR ligand-binding domain-containing protein [Deltaproteobacteria bacterium]
MAASPEHRSRYSLRDLVDIEGLRATLEKFSVATGFTTGLVTYPEAELLFGTGWHDICVAFHRKNPESAVHCVNSNRALTEGLRQLKGWNIQLCENGLVDAATPIVIEGVHLADLFTGQILLEEAQPARFIEQAHRYGYDLESYLDALSRVPVVSEVRLRQTLTFLAEVASLIAKQGLAKLRDAERHRELERALAAERQAEAGLSHSRAHLRTLLDTLPDLVWLKDPQGVYLSCNTRFAQLYGTPEAEIVGRDDFAFVDPELAEFFRANDRAAVAHGGPRLNEELLTFACDGHQELLETVKTPMYDEEGRLVGVLGIGRDISERRRAAEEREQLQAQLAQSQKMESVGRLAGGVAHDLNNLLAPVLGYSDLLLQDLSARDPRREDLEQIHSAALKARALVRQLLAFGRKQSLHIQPVAINDIITSFAGLLRRSVTETVDMRLELGDGLPQVMADVGQVEQVLMNLVVNAGDAMPNGGSLVVTTSVTTADARCAARVGVKPGRYVVLEVRDSGCGIRSEDRERIFEPFFSTKGQRGTGLGLATVYGIVKQHEGAIEVDSAPTAGTAMRIYLPAASTTAAPAAPEAEARQPGGTEHLLLVEDDPQVRRLVHTLLKRQGYQVTVATSAPQALALLRSPEGARIDLLLTDVIMPTMNGRQLYEQARPHLPALQVIYMSGYPDEIVNRQGGLEGEVAYLQKPFTGQDLAAVVSATLRPRR